MDEKFLPRWFSPKEAAFYCGYSISTFKKLVRKCRVPKDGFYINRYDRHDIERWMKSPRCFIEDEFPTEKKWTGSYTEVHDLIWKLLSDQKLQPVESEPLPDRQELSEKFAALRAEREKDRMI